MIIEGFVKEKFNPEINLYKRDFSHFNEKEFEEIVIIGSNWEQICDLVKHDPNLSCKSFYDTINFHLDEMAPYKKVTRKEYKLMLKPWVTKEILQKCKMRDSLIKSISKENDPAQITSLHIDYKKRRNEITKEKRDNKKEYYAKYFENNKRKSSETWKGIRALVNIKSTKCSNIKLLDKNKNLISDSKKSIFNNHFSTILAQRLNSGFHFILAISKIT